MIIAVVGSGGKTTLIKQLASRYRREGKTVLVTTTTHMFFLLSIIQSIWLDFFIF